MEVEQQAGEQAGLGDAEQHADAEETPGSDGEGGGAEQMPR